MARVRPRAFWLLLLVIAAAGFALRIAAAQGALWLDEAWSAVFARDAGTPLGVFLNINHDNNHHLNTVWLQIVGIGAPPPLARAPSIIAGTVSVIVAGLLGARRSDGAGLVTAALFAVSPILVLLGSEARGYVPMTLALLCALLLTDRWVSRAQPWRPALALALLALIGAFFQLTMAFGIVALGGWALVALVTRDGVKRGLWEALRLLTPAVLALVLVAVLVAGAGYAGSGGFRFGEYRAFAIGPYRDALTTLLESTVGLPPLSPWWLALIPLLVAGAWVAGVRRMSFHAFAILGLPLAMFVLHVANTGHPRYYLVAAVALLLMLGEWIGQSLTHADWRRWAAGGVLVAIVAGALRADAVLIADQRADPGAAIRAMAARAPDGATLHVDRPSGVAVAEVAAAEARYPLAITRLGCPPARFLIVDRFHGEAFSAHEVRCGVRYRPIAAATPRSYSGAYWTLYEAAR